jgi:hypothetical protein
MTEPSPTPDAPESLNPYKAVSAWLKSGRASPPPWPVASPQLDAVWKELWIAHEDDIAGLMDRWRVVAAVWPDVLTLVVELATFALIDKECMRATLDAVHAGEFERAAVAFEKRLSSGGSARHSLWYFRHCLYQLLPAPPPLAEIVAPRELPPPPPLPGPPLSDSPNGLDLRLAPDEPRAAGMLLERLKVIRHPAILAGTELCFHEGVNVASVRDGDAEPLLDLVSRVFRSDFSGVAPEDLAIEFTLANSDTRARVDLGAQRLTVRVVFEDLATGRETGNLRASHLGASFERGREVHPLRLAGLPMDSGALPELLMQAAYGFWGGIMPGEGVTLTTTELLLRNAFKLAKSWWSCRNDVALQSGLDAPDPVAPEGAVCGAAHAQVRRKGGGWELSGGRFMPPEVRAWLVREAMYAPDLREGPWMQAARIAALAPVVTALGFASMEVGVLPPTVALNKGWMTWTFPGIRARFRRDDGRLVDEADLDEGARALIRLGWSAAVVVGGWIVTQPLHGLDSRAISAVADLAEGRQMFIARTADLHRMAHGRPII